MKLKKAATVLPCWCAVLTIQILWPWTALHTEPKWLDFARRHPEITLEIRTKCASLHPFQGAPCRNVIIAYTVCPASSQKEYEHGTSSVSSRIQSAKTLSRQGWRIRLCMEPIVTQCPIQEYQQLVQSIFCDRDKFEDIVIGTFRMNQQYYQTLRKLRPFCKMLCSPYMVTDGKMVQDTLAESYISQISSEIQKYTNIPIIVFDGPRQILAKLLTFFCKYIIIYAYLFPEKHFLEEAKTNTRCFHTVCAC